MLLIGLIISTLIILLILKWWYLKYKYFDTGLYRKYKGPKMYPIIGNVFVDVIFRTPHEYLEYGTEECFKYGGSLICQLGYYYAMFITEYKLTEHIMSSTTITTKAEPYRFGMKWAGTGLLLSNGEKWRKRRKMITPAFHYQILETFLEVFHSASDTLVDVISGEVNRGTKSNNIEVHSLVTLCTLDVICEAAMGIKVNAQTYKDSEYVKAVKDISKLFLNRLVTPMYHYDLYYRFTKTYRREMKCINYLHSHTNGIIKARRKELLDKLQDKDTTAYTPETGVGNKCAFLDVLLQSTIDGKPLSDEDIREEVDTFMFEGHDTTASAISFAIFSIAQFPDVQAKILQEQEMIFGGNRERAPTFNELNNMKYLEMVIKETLRLYPSVPVVGREVTEDFEFDGTTFKKGLQLALLTFGLHRDPEHYPEPEKFNPERFSPENQLLLKPFAYLPFAAGPRNCIGQKFAMLEMKSTLAKIIRYFELSPVVPKHIPMLVPEVILKSANGLPVCFKHRIV